MNPKKALKTSLRSATQATDSTCSGCRANNAATNALFQVASVNFCNRKKSRTAFAVCSSKFTKCGPKGPFPNNCESNIKESQVSGCQFAANPVVKAHAILAGFKPVWTWILPVK